MVDVFIDIDVAIDIISKREPHHEQSIKILTLAAENRVQLIISESCVATLYYFLFDIYKIKDAQEKVSDFISSCKIAYAGKDVILHSLNSMFKDKEDALQYFTALRAKADYFITRNKKDYKQAIDSLPVYTPLEFVKLLK